MPSPLQDDARAMQEARPSGEASRGKQSAMTAFVESCVETVAGSAVAVERRTRHRPRARRLIRLLKDKKRILITTHQYPDPDALASSQSLAILLRGALKDARIEVSVKGPIGGGYNSAFAQLSELKLTPWNESGLHDYDAIILLDVQPLFRFSPLPAELPPTAVIDHHRSRGRRTRCAFCDIRTDVGATASIIFSYFMEMEVEISPDLAATMLYAIETDLAGTAGQPGELDNMALSSLTLLADTRKLYKMRYVDLPQSVYVAYAQGLNSAVIYDNAMITHLESIESPETPAVMADFLLRYEQVQWVLATAVSGSSMVASLRTSSKSSAADIMRRLLRGVGDGGGHRTKAGGSIPMETGSAAEVERLRKLLRRRLLRSLGVKMSRGQRLVPGKGE